MQQLTIPSRETKGFTLIELLVVIGIIAILAAILFPVFAQAKAAAKKAVCISNLKQATLSSLMYLNDYDDTWFQFEFFQNPAPTGHSVFFAWFGKGDTLLSPPYPVTYDPTGGLLYPYSKYVFKDCPSADPNLGQYQGVNMSYGINEAVAVFYSATGTGPYIGPVLNNSQIDRPAETIFISDAASATATYYGPSAQLRGPSDSQSPLVQARHANQAVVSWTDGHAKSMPVNYEPQSFIDAKQTSPGKAAACQAKNIGDILNPLYPYGNAKQDWYYLPTKP